MRKINKHKISKKRIYLLLIITIVTISTFLFLPIKNSKSLFNIITYKKTYYDTLSADRQALYDKMKIEYLNIKSRVTGTEPFNSGDSSNSEGVDVSETDNYVRTFDTMKYTLELGIAPNTAAEGVNNNSSYTGGVIKVRAKIPNQGDIILMTWEQDAWMQNVTYNSDKTEIYAEYHVPEGVSITNANQNLTFTIKVNGYKKEITADMKPTFEVWMEGNKPDNTSSSAESILVKDSKDIIVSGHYSIDVALTTQNFQLTGTRNEKSGTYFTYGVAFSLRQDVSGFSDLRGIIYPDGYISADIDLEYLYRDLTESSSSYLTIDNSTAGANGLLNGTEIIAYSLDGDTSISGYYPNNTLWWHQYGSYPRGIKGTSDDTVADSGTMTADLKDNKLSVSFTNYELNGRFPHTGYASGVAGNISTTIGYFAVGNIQFFVPNYSNGISNSYDYTIRSTAKKVTFKDIDGDTHTIDNAGGSVKDTTTDNNIISNPLYQRPIGNFGICTGSDKKNGSSWWVGDNYIMDNGTVTMWNQVDVNDGPYYGGTDNLNIWNNEILDITMYSGSNKYGLSTTSMSGLSIWDTSTIIGKYGVNKYHESLNTNELINSALYEDFDWYDTIEEANEHGKISAFYLSYPANQGFYFRYTYYLKFNTKVAEENIGKTTFILTKNRLFKDAERTEYYKYGGTSYYNSSTIFKPTSYNDKGEMLTNESPHNIGESFLMIGVLASNDISVTDKDSSGKIKSAYDIQDEKINIVITPNLTNGKSISDTDDYLDNTTITSILPSGLSYVTDSANKEPESVTINSDGTTSIVWKYDDWQINHNAPEYPKITYSAEISSSLENNTEIDIKSVIYNKSDTRNADQYRTSKYGVVISNLAGSKTAKKISKSVLEKNESFNITSSLGNNSEESLKNVRSIEILPTNGDENGSKFSGTYTIKIVNKIDGQKIYYTTKKTSVIGLSEDKYGKLTIKGIDLATDERWTEVGVGETIPSTATAIATVLGELPSKTELTFEYQIIPTGNKSGDTYVFNQNMTSDNLAAAVKSNTVAATVVQRKITGLGFIDEDRNNEYSSADTLYKNAKVYLLNDKKEKIKETTTDSNGKYEFLLDDSGKYYVQFENLDNYELVTKGTNTTSSKANSDLVTDEINHTYTATKQIEEISNINIGIRPKEAKLTVKYQDTTEKDIVTGYSETIYYTKEYKAKDSTSIPSEYELKEMKGDSKTGTVAKDEYTVIYVYDLKASKVTVNHYIEGTTTPIASTQTIDKNYTETYTTSPLDTSTYKYEYTNKHDGDETTGTINKASYTVNYYYKLKQGEVIVHHYLRKDGVHTTTKLADDTESGKLDYDQIFKVERSPSVTKNYELVEQDIKQVVINSSKTEVFLYYELKDSNLVTTINKTSEDELTKTNSEVNYVITYKVNVKEYIGKGNVTIIDTLPMTIDEEKSDLNGGTYNKENKTITWQDEVDINTYNETNETYTKEYKKEIKIVYDSLTGEERLINNEVEGQIKLSNKEDDITSSTTNNVKIPGKIIVKYIDINTEKEIIEKDEENDLVGEHFISSAKEIEGYTLVEKPETEDYIYQLENQEVIYKYEKIKLRIETKVIGEGGEALGDEEVNYGDDSTKDYIIIKADDGYHIEKITINGEEVEIKENENYLILSNFTELKENKIIIVSFAPTPVENPNTGVFLSVGFIFGLLIILFLLKRYTKILKHKYKLITKI